MFVQPQTQRTQGKRHNADFRCQGEIPNPERAVEVYCHIPVVPAATASTEFILSSRHRRRVRVSRATYLYLGEAQVSVV